MFGMVATAGLERSGRKGVFGTTHEWNEHHSDSNQVNCYADVRRQALEEQISNKSMANISARTSCRSPVCKGPAHKTAIRLRSWTFRRKVERGSCE